MTETPSGLQFEDTVVGTGASPVSGKKCVMHYTGWLWVNGEKGQKFDSSIDRGRPRARTRSGPIATSRMARPST